MRYLAIILLLSSCSAQYHLNKAIKKGYTCEQTGDTIRITTLDSIPVIIHDSIVWEKFITTKDTIEGVININQNTRCKLTKWGSHSCHDWCWDVDSVS